MFTIRPLRNSAQAERYYGVLASSSTRENPLDTPLAATSTSPRWYGDCRGLNENVTEFEFQAVCCSRNVRAAFAFTFSPSTSILQTYERLLQQHDWLKAQIIIQSIENAANHTMHELYSALDFLVWAACTRRWQRGDREGVCWNAVLFDISSAEGDAHRERHYLITKNAKNFYSASSEAFTECLTNAWPEWRNAAG
jgi:hypothetical protein